MAALEKLMDAEMLDEGVAEEIVLEAELPEPLEPAAAEPPHPLEPPVPPVPVLAPVEAKISYKAVLAELGVASAKWGAFHITLGQGGKIVRFIKRTLKQVAKRSTATRP